MRIHWLLIFFVAGSCSDRSLAPVVQNVPQDNILHTVFVSTSREIENDGQYRFRRSSAIELREETVSIPAMHKPGQLRFSHRRPDPNSEFSLTKSERLKDENDLNSRLAREQTDNGWAQREVTIFVHGYNVTQVETVFRGAQIAHDINLPGSLITYSWPSRGRPFAYAYDLDSILFARDGLEETIRLVKRGGAKRVILVAHSMGAVLAMETLRQADLREPGWAKQNIDSVLLISPDLSVDVFRTQLQSLSLVPDPFWIMVSEKDAALNISARIRGVAESKRLGNSSKLPEIEKFPVKIFDMTSFDQDAMSSHFVLATSPTLISLVQSAPLLSKSFQDQGIFLERQPFDLE